MWTNLIEFLDGIDRNLFLFLNGLNSPFFDVLMHYISYKYSWIPLYAILVAMIFMRYRWRGIHYLFSVVLLILISDQGSVLVKDTVMRLRPCHDPLLADLVHLVRGRCGGMFGFVSSHAANSFALATFIGLTFRKRHAWLLPSLLSWAAVKGYSRIYLGVHYPGDVLFGALFGVLAGLFVLMIWRWVEKRVCACETGT